MCSGIESLIAIHIGPIVYVGEIVCYRGLKGEVAEIIENEIGTDDLLVLADGRMCWASELDKN